MIYFQICGVNVFLCGTQEPTLIACLQTVVVAYFIFGCVKQEQFQEVVGGGRVQSLLSASLGLGALDSVNSLVSQGEMCRWSWCYYIHRVVDSVYVFAHSRQPFIEGSCSPSACLSRGWTKRYIQAVHHAVKLYV